MNPQKQELLAKIKSSNNILVTVSSNPSVDQLAACIGLTLLLNKLKKHATAVFSGEVPSTIEFLKPEETLEKTTDSLRDFIISLDKSKADKLRYKVEDQVVRIFITPYRTSITQDDLDFSQGDFNVDVVLCLGVNNQQDLDQAITAHGRILHDAVVMGLGTQPGGELGSINWIEPTASSLSELVASLADSLGKDLIDAQIATALLTGIVAETERFSNEKTAPETMRFSAELMAAGANQQLVATQLENSQILGQPANSATAAPPEATASPDGTLEIAHAGAETPEPASNFELPTPQEPAEPLDQPVDTLPEADVADSLPEEGPVSSEINEAPSSRIMLQPPSLGGTLTANSSQEIESVEDPLSVGVSGSPQNDQPMLDHGSYTAASIETPATPSPTDQPNQTASPLVQPDIDQTDAATEDPLQQFSPPPLPDLPDDGVTPPTTPADTTTLAELETSVHSPHVEQGAAEQPASAPLQDIDAARDAVTAAINSEPPTGPPEPKAASGASGYLNVQDLPDINDYGVIPPPSFQPNLTEAAASEQPTPPGVDQLPPLTQPPAGPGTVVSSDAGVSSSPPPVPPPLPLDDLSKFTTSSQ